LDIIEKGNLEKAQLATARFPKLAALFRSFRPFDPGTVRRWRSRAQPPFAIASGACGGLVPIFAARYIEIDMSDITLDFSGLFAIATLALFALVSTLIAFVLWVRTRQ